MNEKNFVKKVQFGEDEGVSLEGEIMMNFLAQQTQTEYIRVCKVFIKDGNFYFEFIGKDLYEGYLYLKEKKNLEIDQMVELGK